MKGKVKYLNSDKGFGFIAPEDGSKDLFFHCSALENAGFEVLEKGMTVTFEIAPGKATDKGPRAMQVRV